MNKILVITKKSKYEVYNNSDNELLRKHVNGESKDCVLRRESHDRQNQTLELVVSTLEKFGADYELVERQDLTNIFDKSLVISCGGDGTFLDVSRYVKDETPIMGVNTDTLSSVGYFCIANANNFGEIFDSLENIPRTHLNRLELAINNKIVDYLVLNEVLFLNENPGLPLSYKQKIIVDEYKKIRCSGLLVSTAAGSTGRMYQEGGVAMPLSSFEMQKYNLGMRGAKPEFAKDIQIQSLIPQGKLYIDGGRYIGGFTLDDVITIKNGVALNLVGCLEEKRKNYL